MRKPRLSYIIVISLVTVGALGSVASPYDRVGPGPVVGIGGTGGGSWSVTTARIQESSWIRLALALAGLDGEHVVRDGGDGSPPDQAAMNHSQTSAVLVAAQLSAGRTPTGAAGLQVRRIIGAGTAVLGPGDVLLAATAERGPERAAQREPAALRVESDLWSVAAGHAVLRVLVVPKAPDGTWGSVRDVRVPTSVLGSVRVALDVSATAYPLGNVRGPSAGLMLALARVDELTAGDLTGGRRIAGTGAIGPDGAVTRVGEIDLKVRAAIAARMDIFFVPAFQREEAERAAKGRRTRVVAVRSVQEATGWLCASGGRAPIC